MLDDKHLHPNVASVLPGLRNLLVINLVNFVQSKYLVIFPLKKYLHSEFVSRRTIKLHTE